jgi:hypothetical protein
VPLLPATAKFVDWILKLSTNLDKRKTPADPNFFRLVKAPVFVTMDAEGDFFAFTPE